MSEIPRDPSMDSTAALLREGYTFISNRCRRLHSDAFETKFMFQKAVCVMGEDAARMLYVPGRFTRKFALPPMTLFLLQDPGSVALRDGEEHRNRKKMFMSLMTPESMQRLLDLAEGQWRSAFAEWAGKPRIVLHHEAEAVLFQAACEWAGILPMQSEAAQRTRELSAMIDGAGAVGPRALRGMILRSRTEKWARSIIEAVRSGRFQVREDCAVAVISRHRDPHGKLLDTKTAAVELINVLRPTVAVARYVTFAALALGSYPEWRSRLLAAGDEHLLEAFVQEVRRFYPFFPAVGGRALQDFEWRGYRFAKGTLVLLDLYGTNHDPRSWHEADRFKPERFLNWNGNPYTLIPQGGGDFYSGHRCPGEWITIELIKSAVRLLTSEIDYRLPPQDLNVDLSRLPAIPHSRVVISNVKKREMQAFVLPAFRQLGRALYT